MAKGKPASSTGMLVVKDIADKCRVSERTVRRWIKDGDLAVYRLRRQLRISESDFLDFLKRNQG